VTAKEQPDDLAESATIVAPPEGLESLTAEVTAPETRGGRVADRYQILNLVGRGGMGAVYRARDTELDEVVALKVLKRDIDETGERLERFRREVKLARRVTHPNVARTFDIGEHGGTKFLTMEFVEGESLGDLARPERRLSLERVLEIAAAVCSGLEAAHRVGVVHRDLKPDNVLVARDGRVVITDFGIARDPGASSGSATVGVIGTPAYMAPEQVEAKASIDARADIYALGVMLYELLTGDLPWKGASPFTLAAARLYAPPPDPRSVRPDLPAALAEVVLRCMAKKPEDRFASASEVSRALAAGSPTLSESATRASAMPSVRPRAASEDRAVAVLPFKNLGPADDEYVADGITDDLIDALSMTSGLRVRPRGAVARYKGMDVDPRQIGRELGVDVVVEGSVRRAADKVRLTARLTSVDDGFQLWAQRFDRPANDILVVSDESARAIADALTVHARAPRRVALTDATAVDLYLKARAELRLYWPPHINNAVELFSAAYQRAQDDPGIVAGYARACARSWFFGGADDSDVAKTARQLATRAVELWPNHAEALMALASVRVMEANAASAAEYCRRAFDQSPDNPDVLELAGRLLLEADRPELAIRRFEQALLGDPTLGGAKQQLIHAYALLGDFERAAEMLESGLTEPHFRQSQAVLWARLSLWSPRIAETLDRVVVPPDAPAQSPWFMVSLAKAVLRSGRTDNQLQNLDAFSRHADRSRRFHTLFRQLLAEYAAYFGDHDVALAEIERSVAAGLFDLAWMDHCPLLEPLHKNARFAVSRATVAERARAILDALADT
jgi:eukaryotic-like serine/threonine-protein kinase